MADTTTPPLQGADLRQALWLSVGGRTPDKIPTGDIAHRLGVTQRTVQRWLTTESAPSASHAAALRALISPPPEILTRQRQERGHLEPQLLAIQSPRGRAMSAQVRAMGWHKPHRLMLAESDDLQLRRLMVTIESPVKPPAVPRGWTVRASITFDNQPLAALAKFDILDRVSPWRVTVRPELLAKGRHEAWLASAPDIDITAVPH